MDAKTRNELNEFKKYVDKNNIALTNDNFVEEIDQFYYDYEIYWKDKKTAPVKKEDKEEAKIYYEQTKEENMPSFQRDTLLRKAILLNPNYIDEEVEFVEILTLEDVVLEEFLKLEKIAIETLAECDISIENDKGKFFQYPRARPYLRLKRKIMNLYKKMKCYTAAIKEAEMILELNETDNYGVRYPLLGMYVMLEQKENAEKLCMRFEENSVAKNLYLAILYYKLRDLESAKKYALRVRDLVPEASKAYRIEIEDEEIAKDGIYCPYSLEEIYYYMNMIDDAISLDLIDFLNDIWRN